MTRGIQTRSKEDGSVALGSGSQEDGLVTHGMQVKSQEEGSVTLGRQVGSKEEGGSRLSNVLEYLLHFSHQGPWCENNNK